MPEPRPDLDQDRTIVVPRRASPEPDEGSRLIGARAWGAPAPAAEAASEVTILLPESSPPARPATVPGGKADSAVVPAADEMMAQPRTLASSVDASVPLRVEAPAAGVRRLILVEGERRNPLREAVIEALTSALRDAAADPAVRVVVIAAEGPAFSAGHDLREMSARRSDPDGGRAYFADVMTRCSRMMRLVTQMPKPVIAEVQGIATAAGCQLVAACDLAVASTAARFGLTGIEVGLFCSTPMVAVSRTIARKHVLQMLLSGDFIDATTACQWGLVSQVVPPELLEAATMALAKKIAAKSPTAIRLGKPAFVRQAEMSLEDAYRYTVEVMAENMMAEDTREGVGAFLDKRKPEWTGR